MTGSVAPKLGQILSRVIVPAWVLVGALFKLSEATPRNLPEKTILALAMKTGIDLNLVLAVLIGLEFLAVAVMLCISRLARPMAIFMLSAFCLILMGEMIQGNIASCGCLGNVKIPPWAMLAIDGTLLFGVIVFDPSSILPSRPSRWPIGLAALLVIGGFWLSFFQIDVGGIVQPAPPKPTPNNGSPVPPLPPVPGGPNVNPEPAPLPNFWFTRDVEAWKGMAWRDVPLFKFMRKWPANLDTGTHYVVFYSRTCEHCEEMFIEDLSDPAIGAMTTAVLVPGKKERIPANAWDMPPTDCEMLDLPLGPDWIFTTPLAMRIVDGVVVDVKEGGHREVFEAE